MRASVVFLVVALSLACTVQGTVVRGWTGNWESTGQTYLPDWDVDGTCTLSSSTYHYAWFNHTFATDGVRRLRSLESLDYIICYENGFFNASNPCQGKAREVHDDSYGTDYQFDGFHWFQGGMTYTCVIYDYSSSGPFSGEITEGWQAATSNTTGQRWNPTYITSSSTCSSSDQGTYAPYYEKQWFNVTDTGMYDISAYFSRNAMDEYPSYAYLALFRGNPNASFETDACGAIGDGVEIVDAVYQYYLFAELVQIRLVAGVTYTLVFSTYNNNFWGPFGWEVVPTRRVNFTLPESSTVGGFTEPKRDTSKYGTACEASTTYVHMPYAVKHFTVPAGQNFSILTHENDGDYAFYTYTGDNTGTLGSAPSTCGSGLSVGVSLIDYRDGTYKSLGPYWSQEDFTVVATPWSTSTTAVGYTVDIYVVTGPAITSGGSAPVTTTSPPVTTVAPVTTTNSPVTTSTNAPVTTTTGSRPVTTTTGVRPVSTTGWSTTSAAPAQVYAHAFALLAALAVFFL